MNKVILQRSNPWWPRPLFVLILELLILAPMPAGLGYRYDFRTVAILLLVAGSGAALFLLVDLIARARRGRDTRVGMAFYKLSSFPFQGKLGRIEQQQTQPARLQTRGLMLKDAYQTPALIRVTDEALEMIPVLGKTVTVPLNEIASITEKSFFNGSWQPGQTGFMLKGPRAWRLGFAVYEDPEPWRKALCHKVATSSTET